ncbi:MAG TPA: flagellar hook-length control protein FliK [Desulfosporosinus sp.]|nr:flagellar hook-length control protein FliK [Desulfosporosinus sp.]
MAGINVLSDTLKVSGKLEKTLISKGKDVADNPENAAAEFAAMLSGSMNQNVDPKGQNSTAGQDSKEKQSAEDPVPSAQNPNGLGSMLGYGNFVLPFFLQPMLQSELPAGKEANSGNDVGQGTGGLAILNLLSLASDEVSVSTGMTAQTAQGDNPGITELDKYRQVIANLLEVLSGEITDNSPKGSSLGSASPGTKDLSQEVAKILQGWMLSTDDVPKESKASSAQKGVQPLLDGLSASYPSISGSMISKVQPLLDGLTAGMGTGNPELSAKASTLLAALYPILGQGVKESTMPQGVNETLQAEGDIEPIAKGRLETLVGLLAGKGKDLEPAVTTVKDTAFLTHTQQKSADLGLQKINTLDVRGIVNEEIHKGDSTQSVESSRVKDVQNPNSNVGIGIASNLVAENVAGGKTIAIPVYEQIAAVFRESAMNKSQDLKQLDIQLHPENLGKIQIGMRWENGQVHLVVHASEAATGQLLQHQLSELRQSLTNQGVNCGSMQMGQGGERQQNPHGDESQKVFNQNTHSNENEDIIPVINPLSLEQDGRNRINVTA